MDSLPVGPDAASCGDGITEGTEMCDDGNRTPGDGCSAVCTDESAEPTCGDGVRNGGETDTDCGGPCAACESGSGCVIAADCADTVCVAGECRAPTCDDRVINGSESDMDCGGDCAPCAVGETCGTDDDCLDSSCVEGTCQATLVDSGSEDREPGSRKG